jgi:hypothetical protein
MTQWETWKELELVCGLGVATPTLGMVLDMGGICSVSKLISNDLHSICICIYIA